MERAANKDISALFGSNVFNEVVMQERLPKHIFLSLKKTMEEGLPLGEEVADVVANAMKDWALEKGATHYTHWFQPMTGITAEKHDAFISPTVAGKVVMEFSGKSLIKGEPDASSFPSGGLRSTFEARGYTAWDPTSFAFVKDKTLCIPTAFCTYGGETLDKKTPLLRSMEAINRQALRILGLFGNTDSTHVHTTVGPEQEYFLIDLALFNQRKDLKITGRTLFGVKPPKGQELEDHYFGILKPRVAAFMQELDEELWKLGISAKTEHNEVAPSQHELAPIFANTNIATDHNQLTMEMMKKVAVRHQMACLLHEKPFAGINGSGKHNNWSLSTNDGFNLLEPGDSPSENAQFLLFVCALIKAADEYSDLMRVAVSTAGNDHRLGGFEAPPAIVSIFLGDELTGIFEAIETGKPNKATAGSFLEIGVTSIPKLPKDTTDRNRTSPIAFTGNKFEFRMTGSGSSIAGINFIINTIVAEALEQFADKLETADDFTTALNDLIRNTIKKHKRILFNGNNYSQAWVEEAASRGLPNYPSAIDALPHFIDPKNLELFSKHKIFTGQELKSRVETLIEGYSKIIHVEALTMLDMARQEILPAVIHFGDHVGKALLNKRACALDLDVSAEETLLKKLSQDTACLSKAIESLDQTLQIISAIKEPLAQAQAYRKKIVPAMEALRAPVDRLEGIVAKGFWPMPTYGDLLFSV